MRTDKYKILVSGFTVEVTKKNIRNIILKVYRPDGKIKVSSPKSISDDYLRRFLVSKTGWIKKKIHKIKAHPQKPDLKYIQGEIHQVQGKPYILDVIEEDKPPKVVRIHSGGILALHVRPSSDHSKREKILREWYRDLLKQRIPVLIEKWERDLGVSVNEWGVKKMKTRWGSCNTKARRIWLNLELAKKPEHLLDYVVLHEMVHLKERLHNHRFKSFLDAHMPDWRECEKQLNPGKNLKKKY